jgi:hypothetical protein
LLKRSHSRNSHYKNRFFESSPLAGFQKNDLGVSSDFGAGNTQIVFIMRIADLIEHLAVADQLTAILSMAKDRYI